MATGKLFEYLTGQGYTGTLADRENAYWTDMLVNGGDPDRPTTGECVPDRNYWVGSVTCTSGALQLTYFTALRSESITTVQTYTSSTAAGATPTICRIGIYSVASSGDLTLLASIANDTTLWAGTNTAYSRSLTSTFTKTVGQRYAIGTLIVTGAATPTLNGQLWAGANTGPGIAPRLSAAVTGLADLPASVLNASLSALGRRPAFYLS